MPIFIKILLATVWKVADMVYTKTVGERWRNWTWGLVLADRREGGWAEDGSGDAGREGSEWKVSGVDRVPTHPGESNVDIALVISSEAYSFLSHLFFFFSSSFLPTSFFFSLYFCFSPSFSLSRRSTYILVYSLVLYMKAVCRVPGTISSCSCPGTISSCSLMSHTHHFWLVLYLPPWEKKKAAMLCFLSLTWNLRKCLFGSNILGPHASAGP